MQVHATLLAMQKVGRIPFHQLNIMWINDMIGLTTDKLMGSCPLTPRLCESQYRPPSLWPSWRSTDPRPSHMPYAHKHTHTHTHTHAPIYIHTHTHRHDCQCRYKAIKRRVIIIKNMFIWPLYVHTHSVCVCVCSCLSVFGCVLKSYIPSSAGVISLQILMICVWVRVCVYVRGREGGLNGQGSHK